MSGRVWAQGLCYPRFRLRGDLGVARSPLRGGQHCFPGCRTGNECPLANSSRDVLMQTSVGLTRDSAWGSWPCSLDGRSPPAALSPGDDTPPSTGSLRPGGIIQTGATPGEPGRCLETWTRHVSAGPALTCSGHFFHQNRKRHTLTSAQTTRGSRDYPPPVANKPSL